MNTHDREHEERLQVEAEQAERQGLPPGGNPVVDEYRLVLRALRQPPGAGLPADFAARVARRVMFADEQGSAEDWFITAMMLVMAGAGLYYLQPMLAQIVGAFHVRVPALPLPLLAATAVAVFAAWAVDRGAIRWRDAHH